MALEIQSTLPHPPSTVPPMMKGVHITFVLTALCYFGVSIAGFWRFGVGVAGNVLLAFDNGPGRYVVAAANMMVVVHVAAAFQVSGFCLCFVCFLVFYQSGAQPVAKPRARAPSPLNPAQPARPPPPTHTRNKTTRCIHSPCFS